MRKGVGGGEGKEEKEMNQRSGACVYIFWPAKGIQHIPYMLLVRTVH